MRGVQSTEPYQLEGFCSINRVYKGGLVNSIVYIRGVQSTEPYLQRGFSQLNRIYTEPTGISQLRRGGDACVQVGGSVAMPESVLLARVRACPGAAGMVCRPRPMAPCLHRSVSS